MNLERSTGEAVASSTATTPAHILYFARSPPVPSLLIRKRVIMVEPKVPLANERTFLAWMEWAIFLSSASIAFASVPSSDTDPLFIQLLSVAMIPFAVGAIVHAFNQCKLYYVHRRVENSYSYVVFLLYVSLNFDNLIALRSLCVPSDTKRSYMILHGESTDKFFDKKNPVFFSVALTFFLIYFFIGKIFIHIHR